LKLFFGKDENWKKKVDFDHLSNIKITKNQILTPNHTATPRNDSTLGLVSLNYFLRLVRINSLSTLEKLTELIVLWIAFA